MMLYTNIEITKRAKRISALTCVFERHSSFLSLFFAFVQVSCSSSGSLRRLTGPSTSAEESTVARK